jgi:hypothetical protein
VLEELRPDGPELLGLSRRQQLLQAERFINSILGLREAREVTVLVVPLLHDRHHERSFVIHVGHLVRSRCSLGGYFHHRN